MSEQKIIDADLHVQDPHEIILGYFDTNNDVDFIKGDYNKYKKRLGILIGVFVFMKFFFEEAFISKFFTFQVVLISVLLAVFAYFVLPFFMRLIQHSCKDGVRGIFYNIFLISVIVLLIGAFV